MTLIPYILMMAFFSVVLLAAMTLQVILAYFLKREAGRLANGKDTHEKLKQLSVDVRAVERDIVGLGDLVATLGNRAAVRKRRSKAAPDERTEEDIIEENKHLFGEEA